VQKRLGSRVRKLKEELKGKTLEDGKKFSGQNRMTGKKIDILQQYYGKAIRDHCHKEDIQDMKRAVLAISQHYLNNHEYCPPGLPSWCKGARAVG